MAEKYWKERAVTFHSWRHYYAARMADKVEARTTSCWPPATRPGPCSTTMLSLPWNPTWRGLRRRPPRCSRISYPSRDTRLDGEPRHSLNVLLRYGESMAM